MDDLSDYSARWDYFKKHYPVEYEQAVVLLSYPEFAGDIDFAEYLMDEAGVPKNRLTP